MRRIRRALVLATVEILLCCVGIGHAFAQAGRIHEFKHNSWTNESGAPSFVTDLAQSRDGYLWLAARGGVYRFDGVTFERMHYADPDDEGITPTRLHAGRDGTLWVGLPGTLASYREGRIHKIQSPKLGTIIQIEEAHDGALWVRTATPDEGLYRYAHGRFEQIGASWGIPKGWIGRILTARDGATWIVAPGKLLFLPKGSRRFHVMDEDVSTYGGLVEDAAGNLWFSGREGTRIVREASSALTKPKKGVAYPAQKNIRGTSPLIDRDGGLWGATWSRGLFYIPPGARVPFPAGLDTFTVKDGLSADAALVILEDREGNIWVGTERGLDRFRATPVVMEAAIEPSAQGYLITGDASGNVFIASGNTIFAIPPRQPPRIVARWPEPLDAMCASRDGSVWLSSNAHIGKLTNGSVRMERPAGSSMSSYGCREDSEGRVWFAAGQGRTLGRLPDGRWVDPLPPEKDFSPFPDVALSPEGPVVVKLGTENIRLIGRGTISTVAQRIFGPRDILAIAEGRNALFLMTGDGFGRWRSNRFQKLGRASYPWLSMRGLLQTPQGETWMIGGNGILRIPTQKLDFAFDQPGARLPYQRYDVNDGLAADAQHVGYRGPQIARGGDGRLWFLTSTGVARIDPANLRKNLVAPSVAIRSLSAGGKAYVDPVKITLPSGTSNLDIAYSALSLSVPGRVAFRYQLEGYDRDWVDPDGRREAFYTNLGPGRYRFRVIAANNDGVWNRTGAALDIEIPPTFFQTRWFILLCLVPVILLGWLVYRLRLRQVAGRIRSQIETRMAERERIARDLHDTLLQSVQGLILRFQAVANGVPAELPARANMESALEQAEEVLVEGRERVRDLRSDYRTEDFGLVLKELASRHYFGQQVKVQVVIEGIQRRLHPLVSDELAKIAGEALANASRHAGASRIDIAAIFGARRFVLRVEDDGIGIDAQTAATGFRPGHYGLPGMKERASRIEAEIAVRSRRGAGTEIVVTMPARIAYADEAGRGRWFRNLMAGVVPKVWMHKR